MNISSGSFSESYPGKDHDRYVVRDDPRDAFYAVFDGAGTEIASDIAEKTLNGLIDGWFAGKNHNIESGGEQAHKFGEDLGLHRVQEEARSYLQVLFSGARTTASVLRLRELDGGERKANFANAGDSRIYCLADDELHLLTEDEAPLYKSRGGMRALWRPIYYTDTSNFIGSPDHKLKCYDDIDISCIGGAVFALVTDGITDLYNPGRVEEGVIKEILASDRSPQEQAEELANTSNIPDDKTAVVVHVI